MNQQDYATVRPREYQHTTKIRIEAWKPIYDRQSHRPFELVPTVKFSPDPYFLSVITRNYHPELRLSLVKVRIRHTNLRYDGDFWAETLGDGSTFRLFTVWEGYPDFAKGEEGTVQILPSFKYTDAPTDIQKVLENDFFKEAPPLPPVKEYLNTRPDDHGVFGVHPLKGVSATQHYGLVMD